MQHDEESAGGFLGYRPRAPKTALWSPSASILGYAAEGFLHYYANRDRSSGEDHGSQTYRRSLSALRIGEWRAHHGKYRIC